SPTTTCRSAGRSRFTSSPNSLCAAPTPRSPAKITIPRSLVTLAVHALRRISRSRVALNVAIIGTDDMLGRLVDHALLSGVYRRKAATFGCSGQYAAITRLTCARLRDHLLKVLRRQLARTTSKLRVLGQPFPAFGAVRAAIRPGRDYWQV